MVHINETAHVAETAHNTETVNIMGQCTSAAFFQDDLVNFASLHLCKSLNPKNYFLKIMTPVLRRMDAMIDAGAELQNR